MTNYNERLDKALSNLYNSAWIEGSNYEENNPEGSDIPSKREIAKTAATKQAITSLTKELVAEAKPKDYTPEGHHPDACLNHKEYTSSCCGCQKQRARNYALGEFEYNLLKALEEEYDNSR